jgi:integrase
MTMARQPPNKRQLNNLLIERLQPKDRPYLIWDQQQHGLAIRVEPSGYASYKCIYSRHGRPRWYSIGRVDVIGLADARQKAGRIMVQVADGKDPAADKRAERSTGTFGELAIQYREHAKKKNKSWKQPAALVDKHLVPRWGKLLAADITRKDVKDMLAKIEDAPILVNQVLAATSAIFTWAIKEELPGIKINPCALIDRNPTKTAKSERRLSDIEIPKFWAAFDSVGLVEGSALKMILLTGQRPGEVAHMRSEHIVDGWWSMPGAPVAKLGWPGTKNKQSHKVFLPLAAQRIITDLGSTGMVFAGARGKAVSGLDGDMRDICQKLEVERATPHDLRRTHSSAVAKLFSRDAMNRICNHREGGIADIYDADKYEVETKTIMEAVAAKFMGLIEGTPDNVLHPAFGKVQ